MALDAASGDILIDFTSSKAYQYYTFTATFYDCTLNDAMMTSVTSSTGGAMDMTIIVGELIGITYEPITITWDHLEQLDTEPVPTS